MAGVGRDRMNRAAAQPNRTSETLVRFLEETATYLEATEAIEKAVKAL
jgi:hypothetical protein